MNGVLTPTLYNMGFPAGTVPQGTHGYSPCTATYGYPVFFSSTLGVSWAEKGCVPLRAHGGIVTSPNPTVTAVTAFVVGVDISTGAPSLAFSADSGANWRAVAPLPSALNARARALSSSWTSLCSSQRTSAVTSHSR